LVFIAAIIVIVAAGFAIRVSNLDEPNLAYHPGRQFFDANKARGLYVQLGGSVDGMSDARAREVASSLERREPPILPFFAAVGYRAAGGEHLWIPRILTILGWLAGALVLAALARRFVGDVAALVALAFMAFDPYGIVASRALIPDALLVAALITTWWASLRYAETPTARRFAVAAVWGAITLLLKPVAFPLVAGVFLGVEVCRVGVRGALRSSRSWGFVIIALAPALAYQLIGGIFSSSNGGTGIYLNDYFFQGAFVRGLGSQVTHIVGIVGAVIAVAALVGLTRASLRASIAGLFAGAALYTLVFNYQSATHSYYDLYWIPIVALGLGVETQWFADRLVERSTTLITTLVITAVVAVCVAVVQTTPEHATLDDTYPATASDIGAAVGDDRSTSLAIGDAMPLFYFGKFGGEQWPTVSDDRLGQRHIRGVEVPNRFAELTAGADVFVMAWPAELERQPALQKILDTLPVRASGDGWTVYELENRDTK
jgi:hypothetical protein